MRAVATTIRMALRQQEKARCHLAGWNSSEPRVTLNFRPIVQVVGTPSRSWQHNTAQDTSTRKCKKSKRRCPRDVHEELAMSKGFLPSRRRWTVGSCVCSVIQAGHSVVIHVQQGLRKSRWCPACLKSAVCLGPLLGWGMGQLPTQNLRAQWKTPAIGQNVRLSEALHVFLVLSLFKVKTVLIFSLCLASYSF